MPSHEQNKRTVVVQTLIRHFPSGECTSQSLRKQKLNIQSQTGTGSDIKCGCDKHRRLPERELMEVEESVLLIPNELCELSNHRFAIRIWMRTPTFSTLQYQQHHWAGGLCLLLTHLISRYAAGGHSVVIQNKSVCTDWNLGVHRMLFPAQLGIPQDILSRLWTAAQNTKAHTHTYTKTSDVIQSLRRPGNNLPSASPFTHSALVNFSSSLDLLPIQHSFAYKDTGWGHKFPIFREWNGKVVQIFRELREGIILYTNWGKIW